MAPGIKTGGRRKGSVNKATRTRRAVAESIAQSLAQLDRTGKSMAEIQIDAARYLYDKAAEERQKPEPQYDLVNKLLGQAAKVAHDVSPYLYPTQQAIKHGGDENAEPIRFENLTEYQLEMLLQRLEKDDR
jgi:hypothetical protein